MKLIICVGLACITLLSITCTKHDQCNNPPIKDSTCDLMQATLFIDALPDAGGGLFSEYRKEYDNSGKVHKVVAAIYQLYLYDSVATLLHYNGTTVYFLHEQKPEDTLLIATFDAKNRIEKMTVKNSNSNRWFQTTEFYYDANRLYAYKASENTDTSWLQYDKAGNIMRIYSKSQSNKAGVFYTYDLSVTAKRQWYSNTDHGSNALSLAQFLGWVPDLEPVNKRTSYKILYDDVDAPDSVTVFVQKTISDHVYDANGNLVNYKYNSVQTNRNIWDCSAKN